jgi:predicted DNA-binding protein YlxM (UPF0122 family)
MRNDKLQMTMLFDFFGDLLTDKQREYYDLYYNEDLSLSEIALNVGITRQGVYDIIARAENTLLEMEEKTGVIRRFTEMQAEISKAIQLAEDLKKHTQDNKAVQKASRLVEFLSSLKG